MRRIFMVNRFFALAVLFMLPFVASAYDFMEDGIAYDINSDGATVSVTYEKESQVPAYDPLTTAVDIPSTVIHDGTTYTVTAIGDFAFCWCRDLPAVTIPETVTYIGMNAFYCCYALSEVFIPKNVSAIEEDAFSYNIGMTKMVVDSNNSVFDSRDNCNAIIMTSNNSLIAGCNTTVIPNTVKEIAYYAFAGARFTEIDIPASVEMIGESAFMQCRSLKSLKFKGALKELAFWSFGQCTSLESVDFEECHSLERIGESAFYKCTALKEVNFGKSVKYLDESCFIGCESLNSIKLGDSVEEIGEIAFYKTALSGVVLPASLKVIGERAFYSGDLKEVISLIQDPTQEGLGNYSFDYHSADTVTLYVPKGTSATYESVEAWNTCFGTIIEMSGIRGDVNNDGQVNAGDVSSIYEAVLGTDSRFYTQYVGDLNGDGIINAGDVSELYSLMIAGD